MNQEFFAGNRTRLKVSLGQDIPIVITANGLVQRSVDTAFPFRQDGSFWYLTGIDEPNILLVIDDEEEYLVIPALSAAREAFDGAIDVNAMRKTSGIDMVLSEKDGRKKLNDRLKKTKHVATLLPSPSFIKQLGMYTNPARQKLTKAVKRVNRDIEFVDLRKQLGQMRMVKQPAEIEAIKKAINITTGSLNTIQKKLKAGDYVNEFEVDMDLTREFIKRGASGHSFSPIVAAGARGSQIHPTGNRGVIKAGDPLLMDVGAEYNHYAADLTRVWANRPTARLQAVHTAVLEVQNFAMSLLKPGVVLSDYEKQVEIFMGEQLKKLGLIKKISKAAVRTYYPHTTSHFLGIDVHDGGDPTRPLESGVVLTVEPGIYIPSEGIGVRIEDDVVITENGVEVLSKDLPRGLS